MSKKLSFGSSRSGVLIDGVDHTPYVVANLIYDEQKGIQITVPFLTNERKQFSEAERWFFESGDLPENLLFQDNEGLVYLYRTIYQGFQRKYPGGSCLGKFSVHEAVVGNLECAIKSPLLVGELKATMDGHQ